MNENEYISRLLKLRDVVNDFREKVDLEFNEVQKWIDREVCYTEVQIQDRLKEAEDQDRELKEKFWMGNVAS